MEKFEVALIFFGAATIWVRNFYDEQRNDLPNAKATDVLKSLECYLNSIANKRHQLWHATIF